MLCRAVISSLSLFFSGRQRILVSMCSVNNTPVSLLLIEEIDKLLNWQLCAVTTNPTLPFTAVNLVYFFKLVLVKHVTCGGWFPLVIQKHSLYSMYVFIRQWSIILIKLLVAVYGPTYRFAAITLPFWLSDICVLAFFITHIQKMKPKWIIILRCCRSRTNCGV